MNFEIFPGVGLHKRLINLQFFCNKDIVLVLKQYLKNHIIFQLAEFEQVWTMVTKVIFMKCNKYFGSTLKAIFSPWKVLFHICWPNYFFSAIIKMLSCMIRNLKGKILLFPVITQF